MTLSGRMDTHSTKLMHTHAYHQLLTIQDGVSILEDCTGRQPLFGSMTALIPAALPHRSTVIGDSVTYKSLYFAPRLFEPEISGIVIFNMSNIGAALFDRLAIRNASDLEVGLNRECLDLLFKILREDISRPVHLARLPRANDPQNRKIMDFIERNYTRRLGMSDFAAVFPYSTRHLSRIFKADVRITIFDYLRLYRILMASLELTVSHRSITEIVCECGYESISTFYRDFNLFFALTPGAFKAQTAKG